MLREKFSRECRRIRRIREVRREVIFLKRVIKDILLELLLRKKFIEIVEEVGKWVFEGE